MILVPVEECSQNDCGDAKNGVGQQGILFETGVVTLRSYSTRDSEDVPQDSDTCAFSKMSAAAEDPYIRALDDRETLRRLQAQASSAVRVNSSFAPLPLDAELICFDVATEMGRRRTLEDTYSVVLDLVRDRAPPSTVPTTPLGTLPTNDEDDQEGSTKKEKRWCSANDPCGGPGPPRRVRCGSFLQLPSDFRGTDKSSGRVSSYVEDPFRSAMHLFAVFDGHGGSAAAEFARDHLHAILAHEICVRQSVKEAMYYAMIETDRLFGSVGDEESHPAGTTVTCLLVQNDRLWISHVGDTEAWMFARGGKPVRLLRPHRPLRPDERLRVEAAGGRVSGQLLRHNGRRVGRVNGVLSVSRAIGDARYKPCVIPDPDVSELKLTGDEEFLVIASDGLWDVLSSSHVYRIVRSHLMSRTLRHSCSLLLPGEPNVNVTNACQGSAKRLVQAALMRKSTDNVTCIVVYFRGVQKLTAAASNKKNLLKKLLTLDI